MSHWGAQKPPFGTPIDMGWVQQMGCVFFMNMNAGGNREPNLADLSGRTDGTLTNMAFPPTAISGRQGDSVAFEGDDDVIVTGTFAITGNVLSVSAYIKCSAQAYNQTIIGEASQSTTVGYIWVFRSTANNRLIWQYADGAGSRSAVATDYFTGYDNTLVRIDIISDYTNKLLYFYRNGIPFGSPISMTGTPVFPSTNRVKYIGRYTSGVPANPFNGIISNVAVYNKYLTPDEIKRQYAEPYYMFPKQEIITPKSIIPINHYQQQLRSQ